MGSRVLENPLLRYMSYFPHPWQNAWQKRVMEGRVCWGSSLLKGYQLLVGKHSSRTMRRLVTLSLQSGNREMSDAAQFVPLTPFNLAKDLIPQGGVSHIRVHLASSDSPLWKYPHRHAQRCVSWVTPNPGSWEWELTMHTAIPKHKKERENLNFLVNSSFDLDKDQLLVLFFRFYKVFLFNWNRITLLCPPFLPSKEALSNYPPQPLPWSSTLKLIASFSLIIIITYLCMYSIVKMCLLLWGWHTHIS